MMRKAILVLCGLTLCASAYGLWPVVSAFQIKQAVKSGDVATLERKVHWAPVRASLKASVASLEPAPAPTETAAALPRSGFSFWSRIKATAAPMLADTFIDRYVTPEGISQIQQARRGGWRTLLGFAPPVPEGPANAVVAGALQSGDSAPHADGDGTVVSKFVAFYQRLVRAKFHSLSLVEFEIADKNTPGRRYISQFALSNFDWKLTSVRVVGVGF
jgi:Protein of unknown function (DUF2939)